MSLRYFTVSVGLFVLMSLVPPWELSGQLLVPMDREQENHLKAYGFTYQILNEGESGEWLLNYRAGSFLVSDTPQNRRKAALMGVKLETLDGSALAAIRHEIETNNMESVSLERLRGLLFILLQTARRGTTLSP